MPTPTPPRERSKGRRRAVATTVRRRVAPLSLATAILVFLGACLALYPAAASWFAAISQGAQTGRYVQTVDSLQPAQRAQELRAAIDYNKSLADGSRIVDPFAAIAQETVKTNDPYWRLLDPADDGVMGQLRIPSLAVNLPIYHGTGADVLLNGAGHLQGTALPVGGLGTHSVITGHRGLPQATLFTHLDKLVEGDIIELDVYGVSHAYTVKSSVVVLPSETESLAPEPGRDLLTLVTCTPTGVNSHRILVTAERVPTDAADAGTRVNAVGFPWWALGLGGVAAAGTWYVLRTRTRPSDPRTTSDP